MKQKNENNMEEKEIKSSEEEQKDVENEKEVIEENTEVKASEEQNKKSDTAESAVDNSKILKELEEKINSLQDSLLRKAAEFENYKRRTDNDQMNLLKYAAESFILKVLPVYDDLGRSLSHADESNTNSVIEGLKLVYDKFTKILDDQGVKKLEVVGNEFDVDFHEALMQQPSGEVPANTVLHEIEPGYLYKDKVIKHAKVIVSQEIVKPEEENNESAE
jgi:molecular chaperone GrpE